MNSKHKRSVVQYITVYEYGKMYSPPMYQKKPRDLKHRSRPKSCFDRTDLIANIHHLLSVHRMKRECSQRSLKRCSNKFHKALKAVIRSCFENKIGTSCLYPVGQLFYELYACTGGSVSLFSIIMDNITPDDILYPSKCEVDLYTAFDYYLQHVCNIQISGRKKPVNLLNCEIDTYPGLCNILPLSAALQKRDPVLVQSLVKFGANPLLCTSLAQARDPYQCLSPTKLILDDLNGLYMFKNAHFDNATRLKLAEQEVKACMCLGVIRRAVPRLPLDSSTHVITCSEDEGFTETEHAESSVEIPMYSIHPKLAETVNMDFFKLGSLKHLSRCAIRERLKSNWKKLANIPKGVTLLPLPKVMKSYLNLEDD